MLTYTFQPEKPLAVSAVMGVYKACLVQDMNEVGRATVSLNSSLRKKKPNLREERYLAQSEDASNHPILVSSLLFPALTVSIMMWTSVYTAMNCFILNIQCRLPVSSLICFLAVTRCGMAGSNFLLVVPKLIAPCQLCRS